MTRLRHDRTGELVEVEEDEDVLPPHDLRCEDGWLGETSDGRLVPCLACRPHLAGRRERLARRLIGRVP